MELNGQLQEVNTRIDRLEQELVTCGIDKDLRIQAMHTDMNLMHKDFTKLEHTVGNLTDEVSKAVDALSIIASNTSTIKEMSEVYDKVKGFTWVISKLGFWAALLVAFSAGVIAALYH